MRVMALSLLLLTSALPLGTATRTVDDLDVAMIEVAGGGARYWPRWRGPSGQGVVTGTGYVDRWSATDNIKWKAKLDSPGNGSPIIWGNRIFLVTSDGGGTRRGIAAFNRADGTKVWETFAPDAPAETVYPKNGYASSTPATDGRLVYAYLGAHGVIALDFNGKQVWHQGVGAIQASHGSAGSPLLYKDRVIVYQDQNGGGFIKAFDAKTGAERWSTPRAEQVGWGTPIAIRAGHRDEIIVSSMRKVYAYDPDTGAVLWTAGGSLFEVIPTPVVGHGLVFA